MKCLWIIPLSLVIVVVTACGSAAAPTATPLSPTVPPTVVLGSGAATAAPLPTSTAAPTATSAPEANGTAFFRDKIAHNDAIAVVMSNVAPPVPGAVYQGWLIGADGEFVLNVGRIPVGADGTVQTLFAPEPASQNLLERYDAFAITLESDQETPVAPSAPVAFSGRLPAAALTHLRHILLAFPDTPDKIGLGLGLLAQAEELLRHAQFQQAALDQKDLAGVKRHAEHLVNIVEGNQGANFGDLNQDGQVQNPGDGYGLLENGAQKGYISGTQQHALLAAQATDATDNIKLHAESVQITAENARGWTQELGKTELDIVKAGDLATADPLVRTALKLADRIVNGFDANANEQIEPIPGEGAVLTGYQHAQLMAGIPLAPGGAVPAGAPPATVPPPTATPVPPTVAPGQVKVEIINFSYGSPLTVKAGTTVVWVNRDKAPHTVTADNGAFASGTLNPGDTFSFTFAQAGTFPYYCEFHGNQGGVGMAGTVRVEP